MFQGPVFSKTMKPLFTFRAQQELARLTWGLVFVFAAEE
jgi:hypothetical protein